MLLGRNPGADSRGDATSTRCSSPRCRAGCRHRCSSADPTSVRPRSNLIAANADIGVAKAALLSRHQPHRAARPGERAALESVQGSVAGPGRSAAALLQPIFNAGRIDSQVAQAEALQRQALYAYEKSIISAFQDVENALVDRTKFEQVREEQAKNVVALAALPRSGRAALHAKARRSISRSPMPSSRCSTPQLAYVTTQSQLFQSYANLYKAMGGGWVAAAEALVPGGVVQNSWRGNGPDASSGRSPTRADTPAGSDTSAR